MILAMPSRIIIMSVPLRLQCSKQCIPYPLVPPAASMPASKPKPKDMPKPLPQHLNCWFLWLKMNTEVTTTMGLSSVSPLCRFVVGDLLCMVLFCPSHRLLLFQHNSCMHVVQTLIVFLKTTLILTNSQHEESKIQTNHKKRDHFSGHNREKKTI